MRQRFKAFAGLLRALAFSALVPSAWATPVSPPPATNTLADRVDQLDQRLRSLGPIDPNAYLELGEEVLSESRTPDERRLARELFALGFELARTQPDYAERVPVMISSSLALAMTAESAGDRKWLRAIAHAITAEHSVLHVGPLGTPPASTDPAPSAIDRDALRAATALGLARAGEGRRAARILEPSGVAGALRRVDRLLSPGELPGGVDRLRALISAWPTCPTCRGKRSVKVGNEVVVCHNCGGKAGPALDAAELILHLRAESALLSGSQRSWSASARIDSGAPLRDVDPSEVAPVTGVAAERPIYRNGRWVAVAEEAPGKPQAPAGDPEKLNPQAKAPDSPV